MVRHVKQRAVRREYLSLYDCFSATNRWFTSERLCDPDFHLGGWDVENCPLTDKEGAVHFSGLII